MQVLRLLTQVLHKYTNAGGSSGASGNTFQGQGQTLSGKTVKQQNIQNDSTTVMFIGLGLLLTYLYFTKDT
jgi:hypothetical protein